MLRILVNLRAVSQALEQQRERLKWSESTSNQLFFVYSAADVGKFLQSHSKNFKNKSPASTYSELFQLSPHHIIFLRYIFSSRHCNGLFKLS